MATTILRFPPNNISTSTNGRDRKAIQNSILHSLPRREFDAIAGKLEWLDLPNQTVLHKPGEPLKFGYFINSGLASTLNVMSDGKSVEVGLTGKEGFVGLPLIVGFRSSPTLAVMQVDGSGFRLRAENVARILSACPHLHKILNRYSQELMMQSTQVAACNRIHEVEERLARWLLMSQDRLESEVVPLTQQSLANMLGTRRASVTVAAGILQKAGLITYSRGRLKIRNRRRLEDASCECYQRLVEQFERWQKESK
jgi:CRP-like cAMP-binding protein